MAIFLLLLSVLIMITSPITAKGACLRENIPFGETAKYEHWIDYLTDTAAASDAAPYVFAFIQPQSESADFSWGFYNDLKPFMEDFSIQKANKNSSAYWYFVKLRLDNNVHGSDIYEYMQHNLTDEDYRYTAFTLDYGNAYNICLINTRAYENDSCILAKSEAVFCDGYMYLLSCPEPDKKDLETVNELLINFETRFHEGEFRTGTAMDEDDLYWSDHTQRITEFENPKRTFIEERATDMLNPDKIMRYFGVIREAKYQVTLASDLPEINITFRYEDEIPNDSCETYLLDGLNRNKSCKMEIYNAQDNSLIQKNNVNLNLSIEKHDTIQFEDINGDGSLEMNLYTLYETDSNNTEEYHNDCWTWNREKGKMVNVIPIIVQKGDCLWKIATEYYNNGNDWGKIYEWNHSIIGDNPSLIYEGMKLNLP